MNTLGNPSPVTGPHSAVAPVHERRTVVGRTSQTQRGERAVSNRTRTAATRPGRRSMSEPKIQHHTLRARLREYRSLGLSVGFSAFMHAMFFVVLTIGAFDVPDAHVAFDPSQGVALFNRLGIEYGDEDAEDVDEIDPEVLASLAAVPEDEEATDDEKVEEPKPEPEDDGDGEPAEDEVAAADPEPEPDVAPQPDPEPSDEGDPVAVPTPRPDPTPTPTPDPDDGGGSEPDDETAADDRPRRENLIDRMQPDDEGEGTEPPSVRYPEGTLHPVATDVSMWGPDAARLTVILRNDRFRNSAHRRSMEQILGGLPDWQNLAGGANIDPFDDVDAMLAAQAPAAPAQSR